MAIRLLALIIGVFGIFGFTQGGTDVDVSRREFDALKEEVIAERSARAVMQQQLDELRAGGVGQLGFRKTALAGANSIGSIHIQDASITNAKIEDATIGTAKIADASITNAKIADATIESAKIASLEADKITAGEGIIADLTIESTLTLAAGGSIVDADGSVWNQSGITLVSTGIAGGDAVVFENSNGTAVGYVSADPSQLVVGAYDVGADPGGAMVATAGNIAMGYLSTGFSSFPYLDIDISEASIAARGYFVIPPLTATIASGVLAIDPASMIVADTEAAAASDDLDTISAIPTATLTAGQILVLRAANSARTVSVTEAGNIKLSSAPFALDNAEDTLTLIYDGTNWLEISRSNNGA